MADQHQVNAVIATAITECRKDHPEGPIYPAEAKLMAKCIIEHLADSGLQIMPSDESAGVTRVATV